MAHTWQAADCSDQEPYNKDFAKAMEGIKAKALILPGKTDLYFRKSTSKAAYRYQADASVAPEDSENEVQHMRPGVGVCMAFPSIWGHWAAGPGGSPDDVKWLDGKLRWFIDRE